MEHFYTKRNMEIIKNKKIIYKGAIKNGKPHGFGHKEFIQKIGKGDIYIGNFKNGKYHGKGKYIWKNGCIHSGQWKNGLRHGKGFHTCEIGNSHRGIWKNDLRLGKFNCKLHNGDKYIGELSKKK